MAHSASGNPWPRCTTPAGFLGRMARGGPHMGTLCCGAFRRQGSDCARYSERCACGRLGGRDESQSASQVVHRGCWPCAKSFLHVWGICVDSVWQAFFVNQFAESAVGPLPPASCVLMPCARQSLEEQALFGSCFCRADSLAGALGCSYRCLVSMGRCLG